MSVIVHRVKTFWNHCIYYTDVFDTYDSIFIKNSCKRLNTLSVLYVNVTIIVVSNTGTECKLQQKIRMPDKLFQKITHTNRLEIA